MLKYWMNTPKQLRLEFNDTLPRAVYKCLFNLEITSCEIAASCIRSFTKHQNISEAKVYYVLINERRKSRQVYDKDLIIPWEKPKNSKQNSDEHFESVEDMMDRVCDKLYPRSLTLREKLVKSLRQICKWFVWK